MKEDKQGKGFSDGRYGRVDPNNHDVHYRGGAMVGKRLKAEEQRRRDEQDDWAKTIGKRMGPAKRSDGDTGGFWKEALITLIGLGVIVLLSELVSNYF
ncbi:MAG: hypothetical protein AAFX02_03335 [Pseudomonadota bacterium]